MGYLSLLALSVLTAFQGHDEGKWQKQSNYFANYFHTNKRVNFVVYYLIFGAIALYNGIGLPTVRYDTLAVLFSSTAIFTISYFLAKSNRSRL